MLDSFSETGASTALSFDKQTLNEAKIYVGSDMNYLITINNGTIKPFAKFEYALDVSESSDAAMHYTSEITNYALNLDKKATSNWNLELGADLFTKDGWSSFVTYRREEHINAGHSDSLTVKVGLKF